MMPLGIPFTCRRWRCIDVGNTSAGNRYEHSKIRCLSVAASIERSAREGVANCTYRNGQPIRLSVPYFCSSMKFLRFSQVGIYLLLLSGGVLRAQIGENLIRNWSFEGLRDTTIRQNRIPASKTSSICSFCPFQSW